MNSFNEFVLRGGQTVTAGEMSAFQRKLPLLKVKAETMDAPDFPHIREQALFLARFAEDVLDGTYASSNLQAITETVFALDYLFKDVDIIPDTVPGKGFSDDSLVLRAVLSSHQDELKTFADKNGLDFSKVTIEP